MSAHTFTTRQKILIAAVLRTAAEFASPTYDGTTSHEELIHLAERIDDAHWLSCYSNYDPR
jgi:hypothetical protein